jgi:hypothetical protein
MNDKELFENLCFLPDWNEAVHNKYEHQYVPQRKDLATLTAELEDIKNNIENIRAREWHLAKLLQYHHEGFAKQP